MKSISNIDISYISATNQPNNAVEDPEVILRKRRTIESTQPSTTRAGNNASKHFNYNKLTNDRTLLDRVARSTRDNYSKSLNHGKLKILKSIWYCFLKDTCCTRYTFLCQKNLHYFIIIFFIASNKTYSNIK